MSASKSLLLNITIFLLVAFVFGLDNEVQLGIAVWLFYMVPIMLATNQRRPDFPPLVALACIIAAPGLADGSLEPLLLDYPVEEGALHAVMPPGRATTARVRALVDFLVGRFGPEPDWDPCWLAGERATSRAA